MRIKLILLLCIFTLFLTTGISYAHLLLEKKSFELILDTYFRSDVVSANNIVDLDSANKDDKGTYLGIDYSLGFNLNFKDTGTKFYLKLERNGPGDYDAPLFIHNTLINSGGRIDRYRNEELLPQIEEFWLDKPLHNNFGFKAGLYTYEVGNGFSLNGSYENFGVTLYRQTQNYNWRLHYFRPEIVYKNRLGPRIRQDEEQGYDYNPNSSNFFAADARIGDDKNFLQPYIGVLADYTSSGKRDNIFSAPVKRDILGTFGCAYKFAKDKLSFDFEAARNFGGAKSDNPDFEDIEHTGFLFFSKAKYSIGKFAPVFSFLVASGNKPTLDDALIPSETLSSSKNRAFSSYSPTNINLGDSISACNSEDRPVVFMGAGYGLHYGVLRPKSLASSDFENLIIPSLGFELEPTDKLSIGLFGYYLSSFEKGVATFNSEAKYLSRDLGSELDLFIDYELNSNILISFLGGYFSPGEHYKEERNDTPGSLLTPFVRGDGSVNSAYQLELAVEFTF
jgi:hypothetical protein